MKHVLLLIALATGLADPADARARGANPASVGRGAPLAVPTVCARESCTAVETGRGSGL